MTNAHALTAAALLAIGVAATAGGCASRSAAPHPAAGSPADPRASVAGVFAPTLAGEDQAPTAEDSAHHAHHGGHHDH